MDYLITIDGGAATGKSSLAEILADRLDYLCINSGLLYRKIALFFLENEIIDPEIGLEKFKREKFQLKPKVTNKELSNLFKIKQRRKLFSEDVSKKSSEISGYLFIRNYVNEILKFISSKNSKVIFEGRDMGTVVFPEAKIKIFLTIKPDIAAKRRKAQLEEKTTETFESILKDIIERDQKDKTREFAPLMAATDAIKFDTSDYSLKESVNKLIDILKEKNLFEVEEEK